jgi:hypothetical protein
MNIALRSFEVWCHDVGLIDPFRSINFAAKFTGDDHFRDAEDLAASTLFLTRRGSSINHALQIRFLLMRKG